MASEKNHSNAKEKRKPQETKDIGITRLKKCYEKNTNGACSSDKVREFEHMYEKENGILQQVYDKDRKEEKVIRIWS